MIGAGRLRERVTIQRQVQVPDGAGGEARSWVDGPTVSAEVLPVRGGGPEAIAEALQGLQAWRVTVRFRRDVEIDDRIVWRGTVMKVLSAVDETGKRQFTVITTDAGVVTG